MEMRFAEANARGELPGITLRLLVEDTGYDPKRAILAARKLTERDGAIAFLSNLGTPVVLATMPEILRRGRLHLFPFSPHEATYAPLHPLKFQIYAPYRSYMDPAVRAVLRRKGGSASSLLGNGVVSLDLLSKEASTEALHGVALSSREFALLQALLIRPGAILSRSELEDRLYGWGNEVESNAIDS